ncbi:MAG: VanW family protein [Oscillospiraceae bacterium]|nr:VanW family protein [Oscillospiraceae bacterium]
MKKKKYVGKRQNKVKKVNTPLIIMGVLAAAVVAVAGSGLFLQNSSVIYPNVTICGVDVGGMSAKEAQKVVEKTISEGYDGKDMTVTLPDRTLTLDADLTDVRLDMEKAMKSAVSYGREGNFISSLVSWFDCRKTSYAVDISDAFLVNEDYVRTTAQVVAEDVATTMQDSRMVYDETTMQLAVTVGVRGVKLDVEKFLQSVKSAYSRGEFQTKVDYDITLYNPVNLTEFYLEHCIPVKNAAYDPETKEITQEQQGFGFDLEAAQQQVNMAKEGETLIFPLKVIEPTIFAEELTNELFGTLLAKYNSPHTVNWARTRNLELAAAAIDGTVLSPDEVFSFNGIVGERTAEKGYQSATVFVGGNSEPGLGGGVCQVASVLYTVSLYADLEIVQRAPHTFVVDYVPMGMDAAIYWSTNLDYQFRNNTGAPLLIRCDVTDGFVNVYFYGTDHTDTSVKMTYQVVQTYPFKDVYQMDNTKPEGYSEVIVTPYTGYYVITYKHQMDADGNEVSKKKEADSWYSKRDRVTVVGPGVLPEDPPANSVPVNPDPVEPPVDPSTDPSTDPTNPLEPDPVEP